MRVNTTEILEILTNREDEEQIRVDFFGKEWGNYVYNSSEEVRDSLSSKLYHISVDRETN